MFDHVSTWKNVVSRKKLLIPSVAGICLHFHSSHYFWNILFLKDKFLISVLHFHCNFSSLINTQWSREVRSLSVWIASLYRRIPWKWIEGKSKKRTTRNSQAINKVRVPSSKIFSFRENYCTPFTCVCSPM